MKPAFRLYPDERPWWSFNDYSAVLDVMRERKRARVLEFGPGSSTLALIEGGATRIDTCEDNPEWAAIYEERLVAAYPRVVTLHRYTWKAALTIKAIDRERFDMALIDGPLGLTRRMSVIRYAVARCQAVLVPTEDSEGDFLRRFVAHVAKQDPAWLLSFRETGPLAGGFAILERRPA